MRPPYRHLNEEDRDTLAILFNRGHSLRAIGRFLGRSAASLSREIRRNTTPTGYRPHAANRLARDRFRHSHRRPRLKEPVLRALVERQLKNGWSPEIIAGRLARQTGRPVISHEAIYQWIYADARHLTPCLARARRRRHRRFPRPWPKTRIPGRVSITHRPPQAHFRTEPGHWEADLIVGPGRAALQVATDRQTRFTRLCRLPNKTAHASAQALLALLADLPPAFRQSITYDNGLENVLHQRLNAQLGTRSFFCAPYHSWEKGTVENTNGLIRRFLPKSTNFDTIPDQGLLRIESWLNARPRKCLQFQSPAEVFLASSVALAG